MPFKSKAQWRACFAKQQSGEAGSWDCREWAHETKPSFRRLPKKVSKSPLATKVAALTQTSAAFRVLLRDSRKI